MIRAIEYAKEIQQKISARDKTTSEKLKRDYNKRIVKDKKELTYYCKVKNINVNDVWEKAKCGD